MKASTIPLAICLFGKVATTEGSQKENFGKKSGPPIARFSFNSSRLITAPEFASEPVAGKVRIVPKGKASLNSQDSLRTSTSQESPL